MMEILISIGSALWLGILTSISPCPLAANIAAISFLSKKIVHPRIVFFAGAVYTIGRTLAYALLGLVIVSSLLSVPALANFLQKYMNKAIGPILIATGIFLLDFFKFTLPSFSLSEKQQSRLAGSGAWGAFALGFIFALAFCPVSAALFFGSLIPLALESKIDIILPLIYGIGTGLPVLGFAFAIALGVKSLSHWFKKIIAVEIYMRKVTAVIFILVGIYYIFTYMIKF